MKRDDVRAIGGLSDEQVEAVMRLAGMDAQSHKDALEQLRGQFNASQQALQQANSDLAKYAGVDVAALQQQVSTLAKQNEDLKADYAFRDDWRTVAQELGAQNADDLLAIVHGTDDMRKEADQAKRREAIKAALEQTRKDKAYLFRNVSTETPPPVAPAATQTQTQPGVVIPPPRSSGGSNPPTLTEFLNMGSTERIALKTRDPALFTQLSEQVHALQR